MAGATLLKRTPDEVETIQAPMSLEDASETYAALKRKREELSGPHLGALYREMDQIAKKLRNAPAERGVDTRVAKLLADVEPQGQGVELEAATELRARQAELRQQINDATRALKVVEERMDRERTAASVQVCNAIRPEYGRRVRAVCDALLQAHQAQMELQDLVNDLERHDVAWGSLNPMQPTFLSAPTDNHGRVANYLREAVQHGYFDATSIPERLR